MRPSVLPPSHPSVQQTFTEHLAPPQALRTQEETYLNISFPSAHTRARQGWPHASTALGSGKRDSLGPTTKTVSLSKQKDTQREPPPSSV